MSWWNSDSDTVHTEENSSSSNAPSAFKSTSSAGKAIPCPGRQRGGRDAAKYLLDTFIERRGQFYSKEMSSPVSAWEACSRLSAHIAFGTVSIRETFQRVERQREKLREMDKSVKTKALKPAGWAMSLQSMSSRLRWHCHFIQKLEDEPELEYRNLHPAYDNLRTEKFENFTEEEKRRLEAWKYGKTGYPMIDAVMRALIDTGWVNFRMRAMLVSFASFHLFLHWREPALWLAKMFVDYEPGIHYSQFQMQAGTTGINTIRCYSPHKQAYDQDPDGCFIRKWVPELANVPLKFLHEPYLMKDTKENSDAISNSVRWMTAEMISKKVDDAEKRLAKNLAKKTKNEMSRTGKAVQVSARNTTEAFENRRKVMFKDKSLSEDERMKDKIVLGVDRDYMVETGTKKRRPSRLFKKSEFFSLSDDVDADSNSCSSDDEGFGSTNQFDPNTDAKFRCYPDPVVDEKEARKFALDRIHALRKRREVILVSKQVAFKHGSRKGRSEENPKNIFARDPNNKSALKGFGENLDRNPKRRRKDVTENGDLLPAKIDEKMLATFDSETRWDESEQNDFDRRAPKDDFCPTKAFMSTANGRTIQSSDNSSTTNGSTVTKGMNTGNSTASAATAGHPSVVNFFKNQEDKYSAKVNAKKRKSSSSAEKKPSKPPTVLDLTGEISSDDDVCMMPQKSTINDDISNGLLRDGENDVEGEIIELSSDTE